MNWNDRITILSVNPDIATRDEVARLAADLMEARSRVELLHVAVCQAVASLNQGDESYKAHGILRQVLADYADRND